MRKSCDGKPVNTKASGSLTKRSVGRIFHELYENANIGIFIFTA